MHGNNWYPHVPMSFWTLHFLFSPHFPSSHSSLVPFHCPISSPSLLVIVVPRMVLCWHSLKTLESTGSSADCGQTLLSWAVARGCSKPPHWIGAWICLCSEEVQKIYKMHACQEMISHIVLFIIHEVTNLYLYDSQPDTSKLSRGIMFTMTN